MLNLQTGITATFPFAYPLVCHIQNCPIFPFVVNEGGWSL